MSTVENDDIREMQIFFKLEPLGDGERTLISGYGQSELKPWWRAFVVSYWENALVDSVMNLATVARMPKYGEATAAAAGDRTERVMVPAFRGDVGRALDATRIVHGSIDRLGETYVFTASLVEIEGGRVERRVSRESADPSSLAAGVRAAATELARP